MLTIFTITLHIITGRRYLYSLLSICVSYLLMLFSNLPILFVWYFFWSPEYILQAAWLSLITAVLGSVFQLAALRYLPVRQFYKSLCKIPASVSYFILLFLAILALLCSLSTELYLCAGIYKIFLIIETLNYKHYSSAQASLPTDAGKHSGHHFRTGLLLYFVRRLLSRVFPKFPHQTRENPRAPITRIWGTRGDTVGDRSTRTFRRCVRRCLGRTAFLLPDHVAEAGKCLIQTAYPVDQSQLYCLTSLQHGTDIVGNLVGA